VVQPGSLGPRLVQITEITHLVEMAGEAKRGGEFLAGLARETVDDVRGQVDRRVQPPDVVGGSSGCTLTSNDGSSASESWETRLQGITYLRHFLTDDLLVNIG
jgi:hypothetical protein